MDGAFACILVVSTFIVLVSSMKCHQVCYIGSEYDPQPRTSPRWFLSHEDPCECTSIRLGGMRIPASAYRQGAPRYLDKLIVTEDLAEIQTFFSCKVCTSSYQLEPYQYKFPFPPFDCDHGFVLDFAVRASQAAKIALSADGTQAGNKYHLVLGQYANTRTTIRRCQECAILHWVWSEGVVSEHEMRRFWLRYYRGTFAVGKHQQAAYFEWTDTETPATPVRFYGSGSWNLNQTWAFYHSCN
ncbi:uncharacterized protein LOC119731525 [Patiria miniata]|uniref:Farnesoic acid O-methyl transferase domain-containing protein n=1 Tax=Patiria miniata TaxID=46514 RepID=A0A914AB92_PATMI|nr:uncharacterized protein LOC119731525 [Patiria miniata]